MSTGLRLQGVPAPARDAHAVGIGSETTRAPTADQVSEQTRRICDLVSASKADDADRIGGALPQEERSPCAPGTCNRQDDLNRLAEELETRNEQMQILYTEFSILKTEQDATAARLAALEEDYQATLAELQELRAAGVPGGGPAHGGVSTRAAPTPAVPAPAVKEEETENLIICVEDDPAVREVLAGAAAAVRAHCSDPPDALGLSVPGRSLLAVNLLAEGDPLAVIFNSSVWGFKRPVALAYLGNGGHGAVLGMVEFCPPKMDPEQCVARVLGRPTKPRRVLIVSEDFQTTTPIHEWLTKRGCAVSAALDCADALTVVPVFKPDLMLVDLALPNGEALRLSAHVRNLRSTAKLPLVFLCSRPLEANEFRALGIKAVEKFTLAADDLRRAIEQELASD